MASDTRNVKVGVCQIFYNGKDLGYTKGGVEVEVASETYETTVDQFGKTAISEVITKRGGKIKAPLAETTIRNLARLFPGATIVTDGSKPAGSITVGTNPGDSTTVLINTKTFTFKNTPVPGNQYDVQRGSTAAATAKNLYMKLSASVDPLVNLAEFTYDEVGAPTVVTVKWDDYVAVAGISYTLGAGTSGVTVSALAGGAPSTYMRVDVTDAVGINLLTNAKELRLHPQERTVNGVYDYTDDLVFPLAATAGGMTFAYRLEEERVYSCEFTAYPDPTTRKVYHLGA